jgi:hypothetical protein
MTDTPPIVQLYPARGQPDPLGASSAGQKAAPQSRFKLLDFNSVEPAELSWRVKNLWPAVGVAFVGGPSMSGKSFWTLDAMGRICRGEPVLGRRSVSAGGVYIAAEGAVGFRKRAKALHERHGNLPFFRIIEQAPHLTDEDDVAELRAAIVRAEQDAEAAGVALGVVVMDTLSATIPGADENSSQDMSRVLADLQGIATDLGLLVLVVAHTGKDEGRGLRGWSGLLANADGVILLAERKQGEPCTGTITKVKDGPAGDSFAFELEQVTLGHDADGDPITTCVVIEAEPIERTKTGRKPMKASADADLIMQAFSRVIEANPQEVWAPGAIGRKGVRISELRDLAFKIGVGPTEPDYAEFATEAERKKARQRWQDTRRKTFDRALDHLKAERALRVENDLAWEPRAPSPLTIRSSTT